jgi:hypothetical protein
MCVTIDERGARIASSPTGFGDPPDWWTWVPPFSTATVSSSQLRVRPFDCPQGPLPDDINRADARDAIIGALREENELGVGALLDAVKPLSARDELVVRYDPVYEVLFELLEAGALEQRVHNRTGALPHLTAPQFRFSLTGESAHLPIA